ncbi:MAG: histidine kinase [Cryomorphaceae bacterium]
MFKKLPLPFIFVLGAGVVLSLLMSLKAMMPYLYWDEMSEFVFYRSSLPHIINYLFWPVLIPITYWAFSNYRLGKGAALGDRAMSVLFSLLIPFVHEFSTTVIYFSLLASFDIFHFSSKTWPQVMAAFPGVYIGRILEYWIIYALFAAFEYYKKYKDKQAELGRIEAQLNRTKLEVLKMQLQPHFLFNALNTISSLMEIDVKKAQQVTARLGDLLRGILEQDSRVFVSLEEEIDYVKTYLEIERVRFEDRLQFEISVEAGVEGFQVPLLIIQPLAENAIKHGIAKIMRGGKILVDARMQGDNLVVVVSDDGKGYSGRIPELFKQGIGLQNTKERLKELYRREATFLVETENDKGFKVTLTIPKQVEYAND